MAIVKVQMIPPGYTDIVHPETEASMVLMADSTTAEAKVTAHLADNALRLDIKGSIQIPIVVDNQVTQILHQVSGVTVRSDIFTYSTNLVTEVRTLTAGGTLTLKYHTDTLQTEVI
jgi:hypothetical protein